MFDRFALSVFGAYDNCQRRLTILRCERDIYMEVVYTCSLNGEAAPTCRSTPNGTPQGGARVADKKNAKNTHGVSGQAPGIDFYSVLSTERR